MQAGRQTYVLASLTCVTFKLYIKTKNSIYTFPFKSIHEQSKKRWQNKLNEINNTMHV